MALEDATHPLSALIMERGDRSRMLPDLSWFVVRDRRRVVTLRPTVDGFSGRGVSIAQDDLAAGLRDGRICPGLVPGFVGLTCINPLRCLGSFNQVGYLMDLHVAWGRPLDQQPTLIAGRAPGYPLDMALAGERLPDPEAVTMAHLWQRLLR
jgi:hypothetical protein